MLSMNTPGNNAQSGSSQTVKAVARFAGVLGFIADLVALAAFALQVSADSDEAPNFLLQVVMIGVIFAFAIGLFLYGTTNGESIRTTLGLFAILYSIGTGLLVVAGSLATSTGAAIGALVIAAGAAALASMTEYAASRSFDRYERLAVPLMLGSLGVIAVGIASLIGAADQVELASVLAAFIGSCLLISWFLGALHNLGPDQTNAGAPQPAGWYHYSGDPTDTKRYWTGSSWIGGPQHSP